MTEAEWITEKLSGHTDGWEYILTFGGGYDIEDLEDGKLKKAIDKYQTAFHKLDKMLSVLGYEAG